MDNIEKYFQGEKLQCTIGMIISIVYISFSIYFLFLQRSLLKGMVYSSLPFSVLLLTICVGIILRTPKDIYRVTTFYKTETQKIKTVELPRMEKVMKNFDVVKKVEISFFLVGILLVALYWKNDLVKGIGIGLMVQSATLYLFDYFAAIRGNIYFDFLKFL